MSRYAIRYIDQTVPDDYAPPFLAPTMVSVSTESLIIGLASAQAMHADILTAGFVVLVAGVMSMAAGVTLWASYRITNPAQAMRT